MDLPYTLNPVDTIAFHNDQPREIYANEMRFQKIDGRTLVTFYDYVEDAILLYEMEAPDTCIKIDVKSAISSRHNPNMEYKINGYYLRSLDSIYVILNPLNEIHLIDYRGQWKKSWSVSSERNTSNRLFYLLSFFGDAPMEMIGHNQMLTLQQLPDPDYSTNARLRALKFSSFIDVVIEFDDDTARIASEVGKWPVQYQDDYYYDVTPCRAVTNNGEIVYSFGVSDSLYVWNSSGLLRMSRLPSMGLMFNRFDGSKETDPMYVEKYFVEEPRYRRLLYDSHNDVFYRIVIMRQSQSSKDGGLRLYTDRDWCIQILDKDLSLKGVVNMKGGVFDFEGLTVTDRGLLVRLNVPTSSDTVPSSPTFVQYALDSL